MQTLSAEIGSKASSTAANGADVGQFASPTAVNQGSVQTANAAATRKSAAQGAFIASANSPSSLTDETQTAPAHHQLSDEELKREVQRRRQQQLAPFGLTERETQIVVMLLDGQTMKGIAEELFITKRTVKFHSKNAYEKIGVASKKGLMQAFSDLHEPPTRNVAAKRNQARLVFDREILLGDSRAHGIERGRLAVIRKRHQVRFVIGFHRCNARHGGHGLLHARIALRAMHARHFQRCFNHESFLSVRSPCPQLLQARYSPLPTQWPRFTL